MEDRFRLRTWDKENKKYIYGVEKGLQFYSTGGNLCVMTLAEIAESDKYDLEQCTGLRDKNDELIYESDILKESYGLKHSRTDFYSVEFWEDGYCDNTGKSIFVRNRLSVVVGNIHEDHELLKEK